MNKSGQLGILFGIMIFIFAFIVAVVLSQPIKEITETARDSAHLDCNNATISTGTAGTCIVVDLALPLFIGVVILGGLGAIFAFSKVGG